MLVKAGYMEPEEATGREDPLDHQMDRAASVFYDYVMHYAPDLISPTHQQFLQATQASPLSQTVASGIENEESHNEMTLEDLSRVIVGVEKQALSYRRDAVDKDYLNEKFRAKLLEGEMIFPG